MLLPKRVKYRRVHRGRLTGKAYRGNTVTYGDFGLQALEPAWITSNQIESARIAMTRYIKRGGQVWIKIFPGILGSCCKAGQSAVRDQGSAGGNGKRGYASCNA